jgi:hypothetical protein
LQSGQVYRGVLLRLIRFDPSGSVWHWRIANVPFAIQLERAEDFKRRISARRSCSRDFAASNVKSTPLRPLFANVHGFVVMVGLLSSACVLINSVACFVLLSSDEHAVGQLNQVAVHDEISIQRLSSRRALCVIGVFQHTVDPGNMCFSFDSVEALDG